MSSETPTPLSDAELLEMIDTGPFEQDQGHGTTLPPQKNPQQGGPDKKAVYSHLMNSLNKTEPG